MPRYLSLGFVVGITRLIDATAELVVSWPRERWVPEASVLGNADDSLLHLPWWAPLGSTKGRAFIILTLPET